MYPAPSCIPQMNYTSYDYLKAWILCSRFPETSFPHYIRPQQFDIPKTANSPTGMSFPDPVGSLLNEGVVDPYHQDEDDQHGNNITD